MPSGSLLEMYILSSNLKPTESESIDGIQSLSFNEFFKWLW